MMIVSYNIVCTYQGRIQEGGWGVATPCSFARAREIARKTIAVTRWATNYPGNSRNTPEMTVPSRHPSKSRNFCAGRSCSGEYSSALAAYPHLERASARCSCRGLRRRGSARLARSARRNYLCVEAIVCFMVSYFCTITFSFYKLYNQGKRIINEENK